MNIIQIVDSEGGALRPLASLLKQHFAYYKVSYFDAAEEVFAELQNGVCPSLLIVGLPAVNEQSVMLMIEARRFWTSLPILVSSAWSADARAPVFEEFKFVSLEKLETSPVAHAAGMLFGAERVIDPNEEEDEKLTLSDVLQLHAIQGSTGTLRFGGRSRARVSLVGGLPVTAKAGKRTGKKALTRLLRRSSLSRCIFDPEVPEDVEFEITFDEMLGLFTSSDEPIAEVDVGVEDVDDIDVKDLLEEGGLETLLTLDSRPTLERIEETMRLLMKGDSVGGNQDSAQLNTPVSVESGELASLVESYELAGDLDEDSSPSGKSGELDVSGGRSLPRQPGNALGKPSLKDLTPPPAPSEDMNKKATLFISHDLIAAAAGERDDDSEWSEFSEVSEVAEVSEVSEAKASSEALGEEEEVGEVSSEEPAKKDAEEGGEEEAPEPPVFAEVAEDTQKELEEPAEQVGEPDDVEDADAEDTGAEDADAEDADAEASDLVAEEAPASEASVDDDASEPVGDDEDEDDGAAPDALVEDEPEKTPQVSSLDGVSREFLDAIDEDDETLKFDASGLVAQLRHKQNEETEEGPDEHETLEAPDEELDESVDESEKPEELEALEALEEELDDDDDDLLLPHFKVRTSARDSFAQEETVKKKALPQQLLALDGEEEQQEAETVDREDEDEDESSLARPENSVVVEPYQELDEDSIEPDEDLSEVSFAEEEEEGAEELRGEGGDDGDGDEQTFEIDPSESQSHAESEEESFYQDSEGTFELVDEVEESEVDAGEPHEGTFELVDEVDEADESADVEEDEVEDAAIVEAPEAHLDDGSQSEEEDSVAAGASEPSEEHESVTTADVTELEREEEREREEEEEEIEHLGTQEFEELLTQEGTMEVDEDAILDSSTEEFEPSTDDIPEPPPTIPPEPPAEDDPWADLAEEVKEEEAAAEVTAAAPEQADAEPAPPEDIEGERSPEEGETQDRDLSRRLRAGARDLLRHLRPPGSQAPTPEASSGSKKSPNEPEHFPREEAEEPVGLEQITRVAGTPSSDEGIADITSNPYISDGGLDDESSFSDIQIEELENVSVLDDERGLDDQLSTVDRPLASDFVTLEFERTPTSRVSKDKQELVETAEQPAVEKMAELSMSELDDEFGVGLDFLGDGLSETINDSLGFSSVTEEVSPDEIISIEEMETNELERAPAAQEHPDDAEEELARASDEDLGPAEELEEPEESKQPEGFEEPEEPDVVAEVVEADEASSASEDMIVKDEVPEDVSTAVRDALDTLAGVPGLVAVALVDTDADACFDLLRTGTIDVASSWPAEAMLTAAAASIRAQRDLLAGLGQLPNIEDVIFGVGSQHYILRPLDPESRWFLGLLGYTPRTNIALTRLLLGNACTSLGEILESIMNIPASASRKTPTRA